MSGPVRKILLHSLVPEKIQEHLELHGAKLLTYEETRAEVVRLIEGHTTRMVTGATPMEIDPITSGGKGKGPAKGSDVCSKRGRKGHGAGVCAGFDGNCSNCGVSGHRRADCRKPGGGAHSGFYATGSGNSRAGPSAKPKANAKGKGKGVGNARRIDSVEDAAPDYEDEAEG